MKIILPKKEVSTEPGAVQAWQPMPVFVLQAISWCLAADQVLHGAPQALL
jgi:hypothetical protein